jgi:hypothetical protein
MIDYENMSFADIEEVIEEYHFESEKINLELIVGTDKKDEFKFSLKGDSQNLDFCIDTRISIEKHSEKAKHSKPHIQWEVKKVESDFFRNGNLHIILLVSNEKELLDCCKGFMKIVGEILEYFEKELGLEDRKLVDYFFNEGLYEFEEHKKVLHNFIEKSYEKDLFEIKNRKSENFSELNQNRKLMFILRLIHENSMLKPLLKIPTYNQVLKIPQIKKEKLSFNDIKNHVEKLFKNKSNLEQYTPEKFLVDLNEI